MMVIVARRCQPRAVARSVPTSQRRWQSTKHPLRQWVTRRILVTAIADDVSTSPPGDPTSNRLEVSARPSWAASP